MFEIAAPELPAAAADLAALSGLPTAGDSACAAAGADISRAGAAKPSAAATARRETKLMSILFCSSFRALRPRSPITRQPAVLGPSTVPRMGFHMADG